MTARYAICYIFEKLYCITWLKFYSLTSCRLFITTWCSGTCKTGVVLLNSSFPGQNGRRFTDDISKCLFMNEKFCISIRISLQFAPNGQINDNAALGQVMAWRRTGDKPLPEPMLTQFTDAYICHMGRWVKAHRFRHSLSTIFTKSYLFSLLWKTTYLEKPQ